MTGRSAYEGITEKPQSQIHESAEKSNTSSLHQNMACLQVFSPFQPSMQFLKVLALLPALNICIHPSWYAFTTCSSYQSVSKPTNCQNNIHLQVIFCKKSWLNVFIGFVVFFAPMPVCTESFFSVIEIISLLLRILSGRGKSILSNKNIEFYC